MHSSSFQRSGQSVDRHATRRRFLIGSVAWASAAGLCAEEFLRTPRMTEGPFYPDELPLDQDNDLIHNGKDASPAEGDPTNLTGRILDSNGKPLRGAAIEIWQCDAHGVYLHTRDSKPNADRQDKAFQGFGRFETDSEGRYRFQTIKPVPYTGRPAPHIHFKVLRNGKEWLTSQIFVAGDPGNQNDGLFGRLKNPETQKRLLVPFEKVTDSKTAAYRANFDIVLGQTPSD